MRQSRRSPTPKLHNPPVNWFTWIPHTHWKCCAIVAALAVFTYAHSHDGAYVFDDGESIVNNRDTRCDTWMQMMDLRLVHHDFWGVPLVSEHSHKSYRPLTTMTFR